ncbi:MAG: molybdate ABC transporter substrate-binding protein [Actinomycetota bacterium]|nr:molybdate ABC transporter substrate-binding protein [Actinomycetota bacterium]
MKPPGGRRRFALGSALMGVALVLTACGSHPASKAAATPAGTGRLDGSLEVFAAASLTGAFNGAKTSLAGTNPGLHLSYSFGGSNTLVTQILQGAPADVFASADNANMQKLVAAGTVDAPVTFARNKLEIAVSPGNPKHITSLADLAKPGVSVVLEAVGVPAGDYTRSILAKGGLSLTPKSLETDVKSAIAKVASGDADATVVYVTDVTAAGKSVTGVSVPDTDQPAITYPIAVIKASKNQAAAQAFVASSVSGEVQKALEAAGFSPPG